MGALLISEKVLKENSLINQNVDTSFIYPAIQYAQDEGLQSIIGTCLYKRLCDMVESGEVEEPYKYLLDEYIAPYLINKVTSNIQLPLAYKLRNQGVVQVNGERTYNTSLSDIQYLIQHYDNQAIFYANRLSSYLLDNKSVYPEYKQCSCSDLPANPTAYNTKIYLG